MASWEVVWRSGDRRRWIHDVLESPTIVGAVASAQARVELDVFGFGSAWEVVAVWTTDAGGIVRLLIEDEA